jgi:signal transduction histidine kinase
VNNAIVHGGSGRAVGVRARVGGSPGSRALIVEVLDRGPGLGDDPPEELFEPFRRGSRAEAPGSGLGLATVAGAVRAHGGTFGAANRDGGGARFWFSVPCMTMVEESSPAAATIDPIHARAS